MRLFLLIWGILFILLAVVSIVCRDASDFAINALYAFVCLWLVVKTKGIGWFK